MLTNLAQIQADAIELARIECHVATGEPDAIELLRRDPSTLAAVSYKSIGRRWTYNTLDFQGRQLPADVQFALSVSELELTAADVARGIGWQHGTKLFQVAGAPIPPNSTVRYWRFYLVLVETI